MEAESTQIGILKALYYLCFVAGHAGNYILPFRDFKNMISCGVNGVPCILLLYDPAERGHGHQGMSFQWKGEHNRVLIGLGQGQHCIHVQFKLQIQSPGCSPCSSSSLMISFIPFIWQCYTGMLDGYIGKFAYYWLFFRVATFHKWKSKTLIFFFFFPKPDLLSVTLLCIYTLAEFHSPMCSLPVGLNLDMSAQVCVAFKWRQV